jgi:hypothetical protein
VIAVPVAGAKPKPEGQAVHRNPKVHDWTEVVATPFMGHPPVRLPTKSVRVLPFGGTEELKIHPMTRAWWRTISHMPHCILWTEADWRFALATALVADRFHYGHTPSATELARRERVLGVTVDARRDLRIRYVDPRPEGEGEDATVTRLDDYRSL